MSFFCSFRSRSEVGNEDLDFLTVPSELSPVGTFPPLFWRRGFVYTAIRSSGTHMDLSKWRGYGASQWLTINTRQV